MIIVHNQFYANKTSFYLFKVPDILADLGLVMAKATASMSIAALLAVVGLEFWLYPRKPVKMVFNISNLSEPGGESGGAVSDAQVYDGPNPQQGRGTQLPAIPTSCVRKYGKIAHRTPLRWCGKRVSHLNRSPNTRIVAASGMPGRGLARYILP